MLTLFIRWFRFAAKKVLFATQSNIAVAFISGGNAASGVNRVQLL
jgi:hypothetical protein